MAAPSSSRCLTCFARVFNLGYNDDLNRNGFSPFTGLLEPGLRRNGRTFFIKMSYLFRKSSGG